MNGLNSPKKRNRIFHYLKKKKLKQDVICLQKTHIRNVNIKYLIRRSLGEELFAANSKKKL